MKRINWNRVVKVKLTPLGMDIYYHQYDKVNNSGAVYPEVDKDGFSTFQLWYFMQLYGEYIGMGLPQVVEDICFYIEEGAIEDAVSI